MRVACCEEKLTEDQLFKQHENFGNIPRCLCKEHLGDDEDEALIECRDSQRAALRGVVKNPNHVDDLESSEPFKATVNYRHHSINSCSNNFAIRIQDLLMKKGVRKHVGCFHRHKRRAGSLERDPSRGLRSQENIRKC